MKLMGKERKLTVLVIDDCDTFYRFADAALRQADRRIVTFRQHDGTQGIDHLARCGQGFGVPDLVLVDRSMPGGPDGFAVLRAMRQLPALAQVVAFMCCGSDDEEHILEARAAGANDFLVKPVQQDQYADFARQVCARLAECWREFGGPVADQSLAVQEQGLQSVPIRSMHLAAPAIPAHAVSAPEPSEENAFLRTLNAIRDLVVKSLDPVDYDINELCRKHRIPVAHARGRGGDYFTVRNRNRVLLGMMRLGYGDDVLLDNFQVSKRQVERLREEWRGENDGGSLAVA